MTVGDDGCERLIVFQFKRIFVFSSEFSICSSNMVKLSLPDVFYCSLSTCVRIPALMYLDELSVGVGSIHNVLYVLKYASAWFFCLMYSHCTLFSYILKYYFLG